MKFFKSLKRKVGNAILPVVGTIFGLTILAGSVVGVALASSKIVYRQSNLEQSNDARQILYLAAKYFCSEINNGKTDTQIRQELQEIFGPGLKITKDTVDSEKYYIWYPNKFVNPSQKEFDPEQGNDQVKEWLKATIVKTEQSDDDGDHGNTGINNTLFSQEAKLDEKFAIGNMMTVYLTDEHLLPGRKYSINEVSLVESDIDTFDEAFTYMNNSGVLEIDDIAVALYKLGVVSGNSVDYVNVKDNGGYEIVYKTGNIGGNYYWSNNGTSTETWLYRQEYDIDLLYEMICYQKASNSSINKSTLKYYYDETNDSHKIYTTTGNYELTYSSSQRFAEALADYIFWKNMPRLCMYLDDFQTVIKNDVKSKWQTGYNDWYRAGYTLYFRDLANMHWFEWSDEGITIYPSWYRYYTEYHYSDTDIVNFFQNNSSLKNKYCTSNKLDRQKLYEALMTQVKTNLFSGNSGQITEAYESIIKSTVLTNRSESSSNNYILRSRERISYGYGFYGYRDFYYTWDDNKWNNNIINSRPTALQDAVTAFLLNRLNIKYVTGDATKDPVQLNGGNVEEIDEAGLKDFQYLNDGNGVKIIYRFGAYIRRSETQVDYYAPMSDETGDTFYFKADGVYMGTEKVIAYSPSAKSGREVFIKTFLEAFGQVCSVNVGDIYSEEEIVKLSRDRLKLNLVDPIRYQYLPTSTLNAIVGTGSTSSYGMKQQSVANKLLTYYLENGEAELKAAIGDLDYDINITKIEYGNDVGNCLNMIITFNIVVHKTNGQTQKYDRKVSFAIQYMTYSAQNNALYSEVTDTFTDQLNGNYITDTDEDGNVKHVFSAVPIKDNAGNIINKEDIAGNGIRAILSNIPYTERINSTQVPYGDHKITIDGVDYAVTKDTSVLTNVTSNVLFDGDVSNLSENFKIKVADGKSLFINGDLSLKDNQKVELGRNSLLFVNGSMQVYYNVRVEMRKSGSTYYTRELRDSDYNYFISHGVDILAGVDAKIMINGNFDYRGFKGRYATSSSGSFRVYNAETGNYDTVNVDTIFEQYVLNANFVDRDGHSHGNCTQNSDGTWNHYESECRGKLQGIYIINGDMNFHAWDENNITDNSYNSNVAMYRNLYSNPVINGTFYVDGTFDMTGLFTSGLYDQCRANFVFAKSISQPRLALNTILCQGSNTQYGAWKDSDGSWTHSQGYLFMICEDAIDFSEVNFSCVNLFTPFQELVNAINANKQSSTNFSDFIEKSQFTAMFPNKTVIDEWGLPSILRSGLGQLYDPGDIGAITPEDHIYGTDV